MSPRRSVGIGALSMLVLLGGADAGRPTHSSRPRGTVPAGRRDLDHDQQAEGDRASRYQHHRGDPEHDQQAEEDAPSRQGMNRPMALHSAHHEAKQGPSSASEVHRTDRSADVQKKDVSGGFGDVLAIIKNGDKDFVDATTDYAEQKAEALIKSDVDMLDSLHPDALVISKIASQAEQKISQDVEAVSELRDQLGRMIKLRDHAALEKQLAQAIATQIADLTGMGESDSAWASVLASHLVAEKHANVKADPQDAGGLVVLTRVFNGGQDSSEAQGGGHFEDAGTGNPGAAPGPAEEAVVADPPVKEDVDSSHRVEPHKEDLESSRGVDSPRRVESHASAEQGGPPVASDLAKADDKPEAPMQRNSSGGVSGAASTEPAVHQKLAQSLIEALLTRRASGGVDPVASVEPAGREDPKVAASAKLRAVVEALLFRKQGSAERTGDEHPKSVAQAGPSQQDKVNDGVGAVASAEPSAEAHAKITSATKLQELLEIVRSHRASLGVNRVASAGLTAEEHAKVLAEAKLQALVEALRRPVVDGVASAERTGKEPRKVEADAQLPSLVEAWLRHKGKEHMKVETKDKLQAVKAALTQVSEHTFVDGLEQEPEMYDFADDA